MKKAMFFKMILCSSLFFACSNDDDSYQVKFNETEFKQQRALWEEQNPQNYSYSYSYMASTGPEDMNVVVQEGIASSDSDYWQTYTINEVFDKIQADYQNALTQDSNDKFGVTIEVTYNKENHYPESIKYSTSYKKEINGGAWYTITINDLNMIN